MDLPFLTALFAGLAITFYVLLDGFDLGVGALLLFQKDDDLRDQMINAIAPIWDGNETWLVMAAIALLAGFPIAYGILLPALYLPLILMLLALGIRGVTFEFRLQNRSARRAWDAAFGVASLVAAVSQGVAVGTLIRGVSVEGHRFSGSVFDAMSPPALIAGATLLAGYMMLGAGWLRVKEGEPLRTFAGLALRVVNPLFLVLLAVTGWTLAAVQPALSARLAAHGAELAVMGAVVIAGAALTLDSIKGPSDVRPFVLGLIQVALVAAGIGRILYPDVVPFGLNLWDAASAPPTHAFFLIGAAIITPIILSYSAFAYRVFRGTTPVAGWY